MQVKGRQALAGFALLLCAASAALPDEAPATERSPATSAPAAGADSDSAERLKGSPLDRLKQRSAQERWRQMNSMPPQAPKGEEAKAATPQRTAALPSPSTSLGASPSAAGVRSAPGDAKAPIDLDLLPLDGADAPPPVPTEETEPSFDADPAKSTPRRLTQQTGPGGSAAPPGSPEVIEISPSPEPAYRGLKKLSAILPYDDYEPDAELKLSDPCQNLCPRPDNCPECMANGTNTKEGFSTCPQCPDEVRIMTDPYSGRDFPQMAFQWLPNNLAYNPLYTEDVPLERYGHTRNRFIQPFISVPKFAIQVLGIPYQSVLRPPRSCEYPLGFYRNGDCVPYMYYQIPLNLEAAILEAGVIAGAYYLFMPHLNP